MTDRKTFRCKLRCGLTVRRYAGKWKPCTLGKAKRGSESVPFEAQNAVVNPAEFSSLAQCERYLRSL